MAITAFLTFGVIWPSATRMRFWLPVSLAISRHFGSLWPGFLQPQSSAYRTEFFALSYWARFSRLGRSLATAISIPKTVEISASTDRPPITRPRRSFFSFGFGGGGPEPFGCGGTPLARWNA